MNHHATEREKEEAMHLYIVNHEPVEQLVFGFIEPRRVPTKFTVNGIPRQFREVPCREVGCPRCTQQRGGWSFRWIDARWTPKAALILSRDQHLAAMQKPWPVGSRRMGTPAVVSD